MTKPTKPTYECYQRTAYGGRCSRLVKNEGDTCYQHSWGKSITTTSGLTSATPATTDNRARLLKEITEILTTPPKLEPDIYVVWVTSEHNNEFPFFREGREAAMECAKLIAVDLSKRTGLTYRRTSTNGREYWIFDLPGGYTWKTVAVAPIRSLLHSG